MLTNRDTTLFQGTAGGCYHIPIGKEPSGFTREVLPGIFICALSEPLKHISIFFSKAVVHAIGHRAYPAVTYDEVHVSRFEGKL